MSGLRLTKTLVERVSPSERDAYVWDGVLPGFGVKVTPKGSRVYLVQYRPKSGHNTRRYTIGRHGAPWTAEKAREVATTILARVRLGEDPFDDERREREEIAAEREEAEEAGAAADRAVIAARAKAQTEAFPRMVDEFITRYAKPKNKRWDEALRVLTSDDVDPWRDRGITEITRRDVMALIDSVEGRSRGAARLLFAHLRRFFNWCVERLYLETSPVAGLKGPRLYKARDRTLTDTELSLVWHAAAQLPHPFGPFVRLLLLTGQRRGEVAEMVWSEVDLVARQWIISADRTKNGQAHAVDLSSEAAALLASLRLNAAETAASSANQGKSRELPELVFTTTQTTPISGYAKIKLRLDELVAAHHAPIPGTPNSIPPWRVHDLRRTAATGMAKLGFAPHIVEAVLNHRSGVRGGLVAVYQHYDHRAERRAALLAWSEHVHRCVAAK